MTDNTLHICVDATSWRNDRGFGRFTRELVSALAARDTGFRYTLLFDRLPDMNIPAGVSVLSARTEHTLNELAVGATSRSPSYFFQMGRLIHQTKFDVFFFPTLYSYFPLFGRFPCVICYHDATAERLPQYLFPTKLNHCLWRLKTALARMQTTRAMTVSHSSAVDLERLLHIPRHRIDVVTEAADPIFRIIEDPIRIANARSQYGIPDDAALLLHVGGMNAHKNILGLLKAMLEIVATRPNVHLAIVGDTSGKGFWDNVRELRSYVGSHFPLDRHVHFTGYLSDEKLVELLNGAAALVFPSLWEGFGLPAVEAMSCGVPVLASRRGSLPEVVGEAGLYFDPEDPSDIAKCVLRFFGDPGTRRRLAKLALERARSFTWTRAAELAELCFRRCYEDGNRS